nr:flagellar hook-length control protein FliK [Chromobacterium sp. ASV5]
MIPSIPSSPLPGNASLPPGGNLPQAKVDNNVLLQVLTQPGRMPPLQLGELLTAKVADQLGNNQLAVLIKNSLFTLNMPEGSPAQSGDTLKLKVMSLQPTLTLALQDLTQEGAPAKDGSVAVALSPASRYLTNLLTTGDSAKSQPLQLDAGEQTPAQMADALKKGVAQSGLFYESHLKDLAHGLRTPEELRAEPQARFAMHKPDAGALSGEHASAAPARSQMQELGGLVQRQLDGLENRTMQFQAMAWPGQPMQLQIEQEALDPERQARGEQEQVGWSTSLSLDLPALGGMAVRVRLVGQAVQVSFQTDENSTGELISSHAARLDAGMAAAGLTLASLVVKEHETDAG